MMDAIVLCQQFASLVHTYRGQTFLTIRDSIIRVIDDPQLQEDLTTRKSISTISTVGKGLGTYSNDQNTPSKIGHVSLSTIGSSN